MTDSLQQEIKFQQSIATKLMLATLSTCVVLLPVSIFSWLSYGFNNIHLIHVVFAAVATAVYVRQSKDNYDLDVLIVIMFLSLMMLLGVYAFILNSGVVALAVASLIIIATLQSIKLSAIYGLLASTIMLSIMLLKPDSSELVYSAEPLTNMERNAWMYSILAVIISFVLIAILLNDLRTKLRKSFIDLDGKSKQIDYLANHDHLTGLSSPRLAQEQLELTLNMAKRHDFKAAILYIDIDGFSLINDALGHDAGDHALKEVAKRMKELVRDTDIACRQGGDEFLLILHYPVSKEACDEICKRLIAAFDERVPYKDHEIKINLSIGVAMYPEHGDSQFVLRTKADKAMQISKQNHKHSYVFAD